MDDLDPGNTRPESEEDQASNAEMQQILEAIPEGCFVVEGGKIIYANIRAAELFGYDSTDSLLHRQIEDLVPPKYRNMHVGDRQRFQKEKSTKPRSHASQDIELMSLRNDGTVFPARIIIGNLPKDGHSLAIVTDITEEQLIKEYEINHLLRQERNEMLEQVITALSHDISTPLSTVVTSAYIIRRKLEGNPVLHDLDRNISKIENAVGSLKNIVKIQNELLRLTLVPSLETYPTNVSNLIQIALDSTTSQHPSDENRIKVNVSQNDEIYSDIDSASSLIVHLLKNAIQFSGETIEIHYDSDYDTNIGCLSVKDYGIGISKEDLERIFDFHFKANAARTNGNSNGDSGLGLTIVKRIAELHGWKIEVESEVGAGSTFRILIPKGIEA